MQEATHQQWDKYLDGAIWELRSRFAGNIKHTMFTKIQKYHLQKLIKQRLSITYIRRKSDYTDEICQLEAAVALMRAREQSNISQEQLTEIIGINRITVNYTEPAKLNPLMKSLDRLA